MKRNISVAMAICVTFVLVLSACGGSAREVDAIWPGGAAGETVTQSLAQPGGGQQMPSSSTAVPEPGVDYRAYYLYEITDPVFSGMVAYRTLIPEGWVPNSGVDWDYNSANAPAHVWMEASSADGAAYMCSMSDEHFAMQYTYGSPTQAWGFPMREPFSAQSAALEYFASLGVSGIAFTDETNGDATGDESDFFTQQMQQLGQSLAQMQQELRNPYFEHTIFEGSGIVNGQPFDVRADVSVFSYTSYSAAVSVDYSALAGITLMMAPQGMMGRYLVDMLDIQVNGSYNENWKTGKQQVSEEIWALLSDAQQREWAAARALSAQLSARVDAIIAHTNAWIASTDAMMFSHSAAWSDYILDQQNYYTGDGGTVSLPAQWDYAWMGDDGSVYVSGNSDLFDNPNLNPNLNTNYTPMEPVG